AASVMTWRGADSLDGAAATGLSPWVCRYGPLVGLLPLYQLSRCADLEVRRYRRAGPGRQGGGTILLLACSDHRFWEERPLKSEEIDDLPIHHLRGSTRWPVPAVQRQVMAAGGARTRSCNQRPPRGTPP